MLNIKNLKLSIRFSKTPIIIIIIRLLISKNDIVTFAYSETRSDYRTRNLIELPAELRVAGCYETHCLRYTRRRATHHHHQQSVSQSVSQSILLILHIVYLSQPIPLDNLYKLFRFALVYLFIFIYLFLCIVFFSLSYFAP